ncbi:MAG TPA: biliverdin-producing heme oxygenase [Aeromicrobium sp.]|nr:biliverdin-producing heme oxygenase [Aeromicrobium sp.]
MTITTEHDLLSVRMREGSMAEHHEAENSTFMAALLNLEINAAGYSEYLARMLRIYQALEVTGRSLADHPVAGAVVDGALDRVAALKADLAFWSRGQEPKGISRATDAYEARILHTLSEPELYVAHHYTRYLGDLSGGQVIGKKLAREYRLVNGRGTEFYTFRQIPKPKVYKDRYRATLNTLPVDEAQADAIVDEVRNVFNLNGALFGELGTELADYLR